MFNKVFLKKIIFITFGTDLVYIYFLTYKLHVIVRNYIFLPFILPSMPGFSGCCQVFFPQFFWFKKIRMYFPSPLCSMYHPVISSLIGVVLTVFGEFHKLCIYFFPSSYDTVSTDTESTCLSGFGLILVIYWLFISAFDFCEPFARQIGKKSPYERQMTNEYLLCELPYKAGAISCVWRIASVPQCSRFITPGGLRESPVASVLFQTYTNIRKLKLDKKIHDWKYAAYYLTVLNPL